MSVRGLFALLCSLLLAGCDQSPPADSEGFAGLGSNAADFAQVVPGETLEFPRDHGAHRDYRIEWWYITANLKDAEGHRYGVQWTLFRSALKVPGELTGWSEPTLWMGHAALTSERGHHFAQALAPRRVSRPSLYTPGSTIGNCAACRRATRGWGRCNCRPMAAILPIS